MLVLPKCPIHHTSSINSPRPGDVKATTVLITPITANSYTVRWKPQNLPSGTGTVDCTSSIFGSFNLTFDSHDFCFFLRIDARHNIQPQMPCIQTVFKLSIQGACEEDWQMALQLFTFLELQSLEANVISSLDQHRFTDGIQPVIPGILFPPTSKDAGACSK